MAPFCSQHHHRDHMIIPHRDYEPPRDYRRRQAFVDRLFGVVIAVVTVVAFVWLLDRLVRW